MFGVLVVVLRRDRVAILRFSTGQRQISLVAFFADSESRLAGVGMWAISSALAELQTGALAQLSFYYFAFLAL
jgi:hypothetical protein